MLQLDIHGVLIGLQCILAFLGQWHTTSSSMVAAALKMWAAQVSLTWLAQ
jgi:hypothetical protein